VSARQAQADQVAIVTRATRGALIQNVDALITRARGIPLLLRFADCVPILFCDAKRNAIGIAHAGWRGTVAKIATKTLRAMRASFGTNPRDVIASIGPAIGPCCYAVGEDVAAQARAAFPDAGVLIKQANGATHFDLWEANAWQLREQGVAQIEIARICTAEYTDDFYSHRGEKGKAGRFGAVIAIA